MDNFKKIILNYAYKIRGLKKLHLWYNFFFRLKRKLSRQLARIENNQRIFSDHFFPCKKILIPILETSHYQFHQLFILAKALELRGAKIKVILCDSFLTACEIKSVKNRKHHPCVSCNFNRKHIIPLYNLDIVRLSQVLCKDKREEIADLAEKIASNYPKFYMYKDVDIIPIVDISVIRYFYGAVPEGGAQLLELRKANIMTTLVMFEVAEKFYYSWSPDIILNNMDVYSCWSPFYEFFRGKRRCDAFTISLNGFNYHSVILNYAELYFSSDRFLRYCEHRKNASITAAESEELTKFLNTRYSGEDTLFKDYGYFSAGVDDQDRQKLKNEILKYDEEKLNLFMFTNVYWDIGISDCKKLFNGVITWVLKTIEIVQKYPRVHLYIKTHPAEKFDSAYSLKTIADFIYEKYPVLPENISLILPEQKINTYRLFPYIDVGIVYNGTLGLEMLLNNIPVATLAQSPYNNLGFVFEPETLFEYENVLSGKVELNKPFFKKNQIELFAYFYFIKNSIPWRLTKQAYADNFNGFVFNGLDDLLPKKDKYLDHLCNCILCPEHTVIESWDSCGETE